MRSTQSAAWNPGSSIRLAGPRLPESAVPRSFSHILFDSPRTEDPGAPILLGTLGSAPLSLSLSELQRTVARLSARFDHLGLAPGDTVCLIRLPRTGETGLAVLYAALMCHGCRVFLPMFPEADVFGSWLGSTDTRAVVWADAELAEEGTEADRSRQRNLAAIASRLGVRCLCLRADLDLDSLLRDAASLPADEQTLKRPSRRKNTSGHEGSLILTTAGSSGSGKLVLYREGSFLRSCLAWHRAGLYAPANQGGRGLCLLFAHSMGVRAFWNAMWTKSPLCLVPPEWFLEHPERALALLRSMKPEHVTGGPAVYATLLELGRAFPDARETAFGSLRCLVSSGAAFDSSLSDRVEAAFGLPLHNAFGTTETLQVLSELVRGPFADGLGNPLPGVEIQLDPMSKDGPYGLLVRAPFGFAGYIQPDGGIEPAPAWYATGDLVSLGEEGLEFVGRASDEVLKDSFGVKVPRRRVASWYHALPGVSHLELFPLREEPGLAALVFVESDGTEAGLVRHRARLRSLGSAIEARHEDLQDTLDDFELRHLTIDRFACLADEPPRTAKGNVARGTVGTRYAELARRLTGRWEYRSGLVQVNRRFLLQSEATRFTQPRIGEMLSLLRLDQSFGEARGDRLTYRDGHQTREVLDFVGGFGTTLLGHRDPDLLDVARSALGQVGPAQLSDQGSDREAAGALGRQLSRLVGGPTGRSFVVRFGSTGAEAVEMALAHAFLERERMLRRFLQRQRREFGAEAPRRLDRLRREARRRFRERPPVVIALEESFHGSTLGARSVTARSANRRPFRPMVGFETIFLSRLDAGEVADAVRAHEIRLPALRREGGRIVEGEVVLTRIITSIAEPIGGEGGVRPVRLEVLQALAQQQFPLIVDEIQTGLGRAGRFLASGSIEAPYILLGKALGGGIAKISALLVERARYVSRFDELYSSTFAADSFSCTVAAKVLERVERDDVPARAIERGGEIRARIEALRIEFPQVINRVDGAGLLLGVELRAPHSTSLPFRLLQDRERLGLLAASYLLHRHSLRLLPTLSAPDTLRVEPSVYVDDEAIDRLDRGLRGLARAIRDEDLRELTEHLVRDELATGSSTSDVSGIPAFDARIEEPAPGAIRVALLNHFVMPEREMAMISPGLAELPPGARRALFHVLAGTCEGHPSIAFARNLLGGRIWWASLLVPIDSATLEELNRRGTTRGVERRIQEALQLADGLGCRVAGLGAYTSVVTGSGRRLHAPPGLHLTTGNTLTAVIGMRRVLRACECAGLLPGDAATRLAVVGASGNIGAALAEAAVSRYGFRNVLFVGRRRERLDRLRLELLSSTVAGTKPPRIDVSTRLSDLRTANVILSATNTTEPFLHPRHFARDHRVLVADLSVPSVVSAEARSIPNVHAIRLAGTVTVPGSPDFVMASNIAPGTAFSCAAETMLIGAHDAETRDLSLTGAIELAAMDRLEDLAEREGMLDRPASCRAESAVSR